MKRLAIIVTCVGFWIPSVAHAQKYSETFKFKSKAANSAVAAYNKAIEDATKLARKNLPAELDVAMKAALKDAELDDAVKIKTAKKYLDDGNEPPRKYHSLIKRLNGTVWSWQKSFEAPPNLYKAFRNETVTSLHPKTRKPTWRGTYETTSPLSIRSSNGTNWIFSRDLTRYITFNDKSFGMRMGILQKKR